jgi:RNA polymerase sigma-70 factor (ECF subfamily)
MKITEEHKSQESQDIGETLAAVLPIVRRTVIRRSHWADLSSVETEDVIHEVLLALARNASKLKDIKDLNGYIQAVVRNRLLELGRQKRRHVSLFADDVESFESESTSSEEAESESTLDILNQALQTLEPKIRLAVIHYYLDEMRVDDIASLLGVKAEVVNKWIKKGRNAMMTALGHTKARST